MLLGGREPPAGKGPAASGSVLQLTHTRRPKELPGGSLAPPSLFLLMPPLLLITKANPGAPRVPSNAPSSEPPLVSAVGQPRVQLPSSLTPEPKAFVLWPCLLVAWVCWQNASLHAPSASRVPAGSGEEL